MKYDSEDYYRIEGIKLYTKLLEPMSVELQCFHTVQAGYSHIRRTRLLELPYARCILAADNIMS